MTSGVKGNTPATLMAQNLGISVDVTTKWIADIWEPYCAGLLSDDEVWKIMEENYGNPIVPEKRDIWYRWSELTPLPEMVKLVQQLRAKGYVVGLLSNIIPATATMIKKHGGYDGFDFLVLSCEVGTRKPEEEIYRIALGHLDDIAPEEVVFLDDVEACTTAASKLGIHAIHVSDHKKAIAEIYTLVDAN